MQVSKKKCCKDYKVTRRRRGTLVIYKHSPTCKKFLALANHRDGRSPTQRTDAAIAAKYKHRNVIRRPKKKEGVAVKKRLIIKRPKRKEL